LVFDEDVVDDNGAGVGVDAIIRAVVDDASFVLIRSSRSTNDEAPKRHIRKIAAAYTVGTFLRNVIIVDFLPSGWLNKDRVV
jgi:Na+/serine symporter